MTYMAMTIMSTNNFLGQVMASASFLTERKCNTVNNNPSGGSSLTFHSGIIGTTFNIITNHLHSPRSVAQGTRVVVSLLAVQSPMLLCLILQVFMLAVTPLLWFPEPHFAAWPSFM